MRCFELGCGNKTSVYTNLIADQEEYILKKIAKPWGCIASDNHEDYIRDYIRAWLWSSREYIPIDVGLIVVCLMRLYILNSTTSILRNVHQDYQVCLQSS